MIFAGELKNINKWQFYFKIYSMNGLLYYFRLYFSTPLCEFDFREASACMECT
jgi:hypothetical protein